jgi:DNA-binding response OmpR family regulator
MASRILVVEDEIVTRRVITQLLQAEGFAAVTAVAGYREASATIDREPFDLYLLDLVLGDGDGLALCRKIRGRSRAPIIMITSLGESADVVAGLELGADDYIVKPFDADILAARVRAALRRSSLNAKDTASEAIELGGIIIDPAIRDAIVDGKQAGLTHKEFELLLLLGRRRGRAVSKEQIAEELFEGESRSEKILAVYVRRLREKIESDPDNPERIRTVRGFGYLAG